jgi:AcrR family transcriptional regulator
VIVCRGMTVHPVDEPSRALREAMTAQEGVKATPAAAFERARQVVRAGEKLDMRTLARDLGVGRSTLYRWTGDRDQLLADVTWAELNGVLEHLRATTPGSGAQLIERVANGFLGFLANNPALRAFFDHEGDGGLRLVMAASGPFRPRMVDAVARMIAEESERGGYEPPDDPRVLSDGIVSLGERFLYHGGDPDLTPDPETATRVIALLVRERAETRSP